MSLIKAYIEDLRERAGRGDEEARRALEEAGLLTEDAPGLELPADLGAAGADSQEALARQIYGLAAHVVELMERAGMQEDYEVTYNAMREIASFGELGEGATGGRQS